MGSGFSRHRGVKFHSSVQSAILRCKIGQPFTQFTKYMETSLVSEQFNDYFDFELEIGIGSGREYPVHVIRSIAGEARETMHFPFDTLVLENRLLTLQNALLSGGRFRLFLLQRI